jgi:hypothetical protein
MSLTPARITYSISFSALVATSAAEFVYWPAIYNNKSFQGLVIYFAIPLCVILINSFGIGVCSVLCIYLLDAYDADSI